MERQRKAAREKNQATHRCSHNSFFRLLPIAFPPPSNLPTNLSTPNKMAFALRTAARPALAARRSSAAATPSRRVSVVRAEGENTEAPAPAAVPATPVEVRLVLFFDSFFLPLAARPRAISFATA